MNRDLLDRPFEAGLIKSRRGAFGQQISYVEGAEYVRRLNDAFEAEWSFEVVQHHVHDTEVVVIGKLSADCIVKMAFGGSSSIGREARDGNGGASMTGPEHPRRTPPTPEDGNARSAERRNRASSRRFCRSGREDSNLRHRAPKARTLPD